MKSYNILLASHHNTNLCRVQEESEENQVGSKSNAMRQRETFKRIVKFCMARQGIDNVRELAPLIGVEERGVYRRLRFETNWTLPELWRLIRALKPTGEELAAMMGVEER